MTKDINKKELIEAAEMLSNYCKQFESSAHCIDDGCIFCDRYTINGRTYGDCSLKGCPGEYFLKTAYENVKENITMDGDDDVGNTIPR